MKQDSRQNRHQIPQLNRTEMKALFAGLEFQDDSGLHSAGKTWPLTARQQDFIQHWQAIIHRSDPGLAHLFTQRAPQALQLMDFDGVEAWLLKALEQFDQRGLGWALDIFNHAERYAETRAAHERIVRLSSVTMVLQRLLTGLGGRELQVSSHDTAYTDTETLYLPDSLDTLTPSIGFQLYKALTIHHWAQTWYGTWRADVVAQLLQHQHSDKAIGIYAALERLRLDACIARDLPGAYREMSALQNQLGPTIKLSLEWLEAKDLLSKSNVNANDSYHLIARLMNTEPPLAACYHGDFHAHQVQQMIQARLLREQQQLRMLLGRLQDDLERDLAPADDTEQSQYPRLRKPTEGFSLAQQAGSSSSGVRLQMYWDKQPITMPSDLERIVNSIVQDLGEVPEHYFRPGGQKPYDAEHTGPGATQTLAQNGSGDITARYPEWDYTRQRFRPAYCVLREHAVAPGDADFVPQTLRQYHGLLKSIRRTFEAMIGHSRVERRQPDGDDIDLDALVAARADVRLGEEMNEAIYSKLRHTERSIAALFMVDMSGSTKGWVNDAERQALVLLCEALRTIGDHYAIYGFSGRTHQRVDIYRIKRFDESYNETVKRRISGIKPRAYTRMGAPIRHLGGLLNQQSARNKLLITLSDGKPEDYGSYYGRYGIEDTRHALMELRRDGIHPFCITIDQEGGEYLPYMYGVANYTCIDDIYKLPLKVADIYRKLTT